MYLAPHPHLDCLPHTSRPPGIAIHSKSSTFRLESNDGTRNEVKESNTERAEMSICIALGIMLGRGIQSLYVDVKKKWETKQQQKREQQRVIEQPRESARFQPSIQRDRGEYQYLSDHEHRGEEVSRESGHGHSRHHLRRNGQNNPQTVTLSPLQSIDWLDIEVDPLEDTLPTYDQDAARLPPYDNTLSNPTAGRGRRRQRPTDGNWRRINEPWRPRANACTGIRISEYPSEVGRAMIWYDALEDQYEVTLAEQM